VISVCGGSECHDTQHSIYLALDSQIIYNRVQIFDQQPVLPTDLLGFSRSFAMGQPPTDHVNMKRPSSATVDSSPSPRPGQHSSSSGHENFLLASPKSAGRKALSRPPQGLKRKASSDSVSDDIKPVTEACGLKNTSKKAPPKPSVAPKPDSTVKAKASAKQATETKAKKALSDFFRHNKDGSALVPIENVSEMKETYGRCKTSVEQSLFCKRFLDNKPNKNFSWSKDFAESLTNNTIKKTGTSENWFTRQCIYWFRIDPPHRSTNLKIQIPIPDSMIPRSEIPK
jgi:hypothetical protein